MGLGQVVALLGGAALIVLLTVFGGVIGLSFSGGEDDEPAASGPHVAGNSQSSPPGQAPVAPPPVAPLPEPSAPVPAAPAMEPPRADAGPQARAGLGSPPLTASAAGRAFHDTAVAACWADELTRGARPATRIRFEITSAGTGVSNVKLPAPWQGTLFARCVVSRIAQVRFAEPPRSNVIVLNLPAGP